MANPPAEPGRTDPGQPGPTRPDEPEAMLPLAGFTIGVTAARRADEFAALLVRLSLIHI